MDGAKRHLHRDMYIGMLQHSRRLHGVNLTPHLRSRGNPKTREISGISAPSAPAEQRTRERRPASADPKAVSLASLPDAAFCNTSDLVFHKSVVWTGGPSTCIVLAARTRGSMMCWHFSSMDALDVTKMDYVKKQLAGLQTRGASFFLIPGVDRDPETWDLKPDCRSMVFRPGNDPTVSRKSFFEFMEQFAWFDKVERMAAPENYKEFIVFHRDYHKPIYVRDDEFFKASCCVDAERMT